MKRTRLDSTTTTSVNMTSLCRAFLMKTSNSSNEDNDMLTYLSINKHLFDSQTFNDLSEILRKRIAIRTQMETCVKQFASLDKKLKMYESLVPTKEVISAVTNRWLNNSIQEFMQSSTLLQTNKNELTSLSNNGPIPGFTYPLIPSLGDKLEATYDKSECIVIRS